MHKYLRTCYPTYFRVASLLQPFPCLNFNSFLSIHAHKVYMYRNHQQKCKYLNFGPSNFFLPEYFYTIFWGNSYIYVNIILRKFAPFLRFPKKVKNFDFFKNTLYFKSKYTNTHVFMLYSCNKPYMLRSVHHRAFGQL